jgi:hypothetical protein
LQALNYSKSCKEEWPKTCYTNIPMLDFLIRLNDQTFETWDDFLKDPIFKDKKGLEEKILMSSEDDLKPLWQEGHGLCTSWCIYISDKVFGPWSAFPESGARDNHYISAVWVLVRCKPFNHT